MKTTGFVKKRGPGYRRMVRKKRRTRRKTWPSRVKDVIRGYVGAPEEQRVDTALITRKEFRGYIQDHSLAADNNWKSLADCIIIPKGDKMGERESDEIKLRSIVIYMQYMKSKSWQTHQNLRYVFILATPKRYPNVRQWKQLDINEKNAYFDKLKLDAKHDYKPFDGKFENYVLPWNREHWTIHRVWKFQINQDTTKDTQKNFVWKLNFRNKPIQYRNDTDNQPENFNPMLMWGWMDIDNPDGAQTTPGESGHITMRAIAKFVES